MKEVIQPMLADCLVALVWATSSLSRPTLGRLFTADEDRDLRNRLRNQLQHAERRGLLQREDRAGPLVYSLTERGRLLAIGGRDPEKCWGRDWDGRWRLMLFDLPANRRRVRRRLLRWLHQNHFGFLQNSRLDPPGPSG